MTGRRFGDLVKQGETLITCPSSMNPGQRSQHIRIVRLECVGLIQRGNIANLKQSFDLGLLCGGHQLLDELTHLRFTLRTHEAVDNFAVLHCVYSWDRLHTEGLGDRRVGVNIDLGEFDPAVGLTNYLVEDWTELAGSAPLAQDRSRPGPGGTAAYRSRTLRQSHQPSGPATYRPLRQFPGRGLRSGREEVSWLDRHNLMISTHCMGSRRSSRRFCCCISAAGSSGGCAAEALDTILGQIAPVTVAEFDTEWLLDHRARRPTMHVVEGVNVGLDWPEITLVAGQDATGNDVLVLHGAEPDHNWRTFCDAVVDLANRFGVRQLGLGAYPASSPHTRPSRLSAPPHPELASLGFTPATLDVPAGIQAALERALHAAGIEAVGLWGWVPHYISGAHYPAASLALVDGLVGATGLVFDSSQLQPMRSRLAIVSTIS